MNITEHEMRGLLTGKCLPGDMRVNEELPAYLVRKFAELKAERDALAAENAAQSSSLKALATLNNRLWQWTSRMSYNTSYVGEPEGMVKGHIREMEKILDAAGMDTPATDAYLNSVRAEGVEMFAKHCDDNVSFVEPEDEELYTLMEEAATAFAAQLRAGKEGE